MARHGRLPQGQTHVIKARLIKAAGKRCQGCGYQAPMQLHEHQLARDSGMFELDHKVPLERGGTNDLSNLQVLCLPCHDGKTNDHGRTGRIRNMTDAEWRTADRPKDWVRKHGLMNRRGR